ncbi:uncharacterized protein LOC109546625 [Dendroctonus ponderosae]|uniref:Uncharacterized protein n=1 Tax=Dendroctonus ponderosae TaxID=77166 RepID=A0AAR5QJ21_DENPD|nr:uncharacterized protein LOC109546625 [Dendroctonus ponderosae]KAH1009600.1 hypothetical protein HUJ04_001931 [Dendroctonus ponderosae]
MSRSWKNNPNRPPVGFVYFNPENSQSSASGASMETSDFVSFESSTTNEESPHGKRMFLNFSPHNCSSPRPSPHKTNYRSPRPPFYSPVYERGQRGSWRKNSGLTRHSPNSFEERGNCSRNFSFKRDPNSSRTQHTDGSVFFDPSCLEDPWLELSEEYEKKRNETLDQFPNESSSSNQSDEESDTEMKQP